MNPGDSGDSGESDHDESDHNESDHGSEGDDDVLGSWLDSFVFDDEFIAGARFREPSALERSKGRGDGSDRGNRRRFGSDRSGPAYPNEMVDSPGRDSRRLHPSRHNPGGIPPTQFRPTTSDWRPPDSEDPFDTDYRPPRRRRNFVAALVVIGMLCTYVLSQLISGLGSDRGPNDLATATMGNENPQRTITDSRRDATAGTSAPRGENWPPAPAAKRTTRVAPAPPIPAGDGSYAVLLHQEDGTTPVAYDPCREIHYVTAGVARAPAQGKDLLQRAFDRLSELTGLVFVDDGSTDEKPSDNRDVYQPERYGERWAPVLVAWSDPSESPRLAENQTPNTDVLGYAGSAAAGFTSHGPKTETRHATSSAEVKTDKDPTKQDPAIKDPAIKDPADNDLTDSDLMVYVTGSMVLDGPDFASLLLRPEGGDVAEAVVLHELGHLVGLDHIDDRTQLMYPSLQPNVTDFAAGDRHGLAVLGNGACMPGM